jgi:hypothetical protein
MPLRPPLNDEKGLTRAVLQLETRNQKLFRAGYAFGYTNAVEDIQPDGWRMPRSASSRRRGWHGTWLAQPSPGVLGNKALLEGKPRNDGAVVTAEAQRARSLEESPPSGFYSVRSESPR